MFKKRIWIATLILLLLAVTLLTLTSCDSRQMGEKAGEKAKEAGDKAGEEANNFCEGFCAGIALLPGSAAVAAIVQRKGKGS